MSFHFTGDLPNPGVEPGSPELQADSLPSGPPRSPQEIKDSNHKNRITFEVNLTHKLSVISGNWTSLELVKAFPVFPAKPETQSKILSPFSQRSGQNTNTTEKGNTWMHLWDLQERL